MNVLIIKHVDIEGPGLIEDCLTQENIPYQMIELGSGGRLPEIEGWTHIVILGGPMNVYEEDRYSFLRKEDLFIKEAIQRGRSVLGICLGGQLIAKALGAKVVKAPVKEIGWYEVSLTEEGVRDRMFRLLPGTFAVFQWHEDTFEIPRAGALIATSSSIPNQAFRYGENVYGLQFHLEVTKEMILQWMRTYDEEFKGVQASLLPKFNILAETEQRMDDFKKRGIAFLKNFFRSSVQF
jgi:GMP synthase-like glutamine amidotransferase